jgi:single-strand DNA-binding protein
MAKQGINEVLLVGNVGKDVVVRYTQGGTATCVVNVATNEVYKDKAKGETVAHKEWHRVRLYGRLAEVAGEFLAVGDEVLFKGKNTTRTFERDGRKAYMHEVVANMMRMFGGRKSGEDFAAEPGETPAPRSVVEMMEQLGDDELPW